MKYKSIKIERKQTFCPLSIYLTARSSPVHLSLTSFATPKFPDPISLIISYLSISVFHKFACVSMVSPVSISSFHSLRISLGPSRNFEGKELIIRKWVWSKSNRTLKRTANGDLQQLFRRGSLTRNTHGNDVEGKTSRIEQGAR